MKPLPPQAIGLDGLTEKGGWLVWDFFYNATRYAVANHNSTSERWYSEALAGAREDLAQYIRELEAGHPQQERTQ